MNKRCREITGKVLGFTIVMGASAGIIVLSIFETFSQHEAEDFTYCLIGSLIWSLLLGEFLGALLKAMFVWMAAERNYEPSQRRITNQAHWIREFLSKFPCLLPTDL